MEGHRSVPNIFIVRARLTIPVLHGASVSTRASSSNFILFPCFPCIPVTRPIFQRFSLMAICRFLLRGSVPMTSAIPITNGSNQYSQVRRTKDRSSRTTIPWDQVSFDTHRLVRVRPGLFRTLFSTIRCPRIRRVTFRRSSEGRFRKGMGSLFFFFLIMVHRNLGPIIEMRTPRRVPRDSMLLHFQAQLVAMDRWFLRFLLRFFLRFLGVGYRLHLRLLLFICW